MFAPHSNYEVAIASARQRRALRPRSLGSGTRSLTSDDSQAQVRVELQSRQVGRTFSLRSCARATSHPSWTKVIEWFPIPGQTTVQQRASPLAATSICSQLSEPKMTPGASPEHPSISVPWRPTTLNPPRCGGFKISILCVGVDQFCDGIIDFSAIGVVSIPPLIKYLKISL